MSELIASSGFAVLSALAAAGGYRTLPTGVSTKSGAALFALGTDHLHRLLIPVSKSETLAEDLGSGAVRVRPHTLMDGKAMRTYLELICLDPDLTDVFGLLVDDVLRHISHGSAAAKAVTDVIEDWRDLIANVGTGPLGTRRLAGFLGEFIVFLDAVRADIGVGLDQWIGPEGAIHDLVVPGLAIEVKTTTSRHNRLARIHGLDQLAVPAGSDLAVASVRLVPHPSGVVSLGSLLEEAAEFGIGKTQVLAKAALAGIDSAALAEKQSMAFEDSSVAYYLVHNRFPRLVPSSLAVSLPPAVSDIHYTVNLDGVSSISEDLAGLIEAVGLETM